MRYTVAISLFFLFVSCTHLADKHAGKTISMDGTEIYYERTGNGKVPVVLIHGWCIDHSYWDSTVSDLKEDYTVLTLDLAGHGRSGDNRQDYSIPRYAEDVLAAMDAGGITKAVLVGHSMAGSVMLALHEKAPGRVTGLIGVDNFKDVDAVYNDSTKREYEAFYEQMENDYEATNEWYLNEYLFAPEADTQHKNRVLESILSMAQEVSIATMKNIVQYGKEVPSRLRHLEQPLQIISCEYAAPDTAALQQMLGDNYVGYTMKCPGHYPMIQKPQSFNRNLRIAIESINY